MPALISGVFTLRNIAIDIVILAGIYFVPALAHVAPFQLYMLDPMRVFMLAGYLFTRHNANAYLLAFTIPLFSALVTGHPPLFKAVLISIELMVNLLLFSKLLSRTRMHLAIALFLSIAGSKLVYYVLKFAFINLGLVEGGLITTGLWLQLLTSVFVTLVFWLTWKKIGMERTKSS